MQYRVEEKLKVAGGHHKYNHEFGTILYDYIIEHKPEVIVEFGTGHGITTRYMAVAVKENSKGHIYSIDYYSEWGWETDMNVVQKRINDCGLNEYITLINGNAYEWLDSFAYDDMIDMVYVDLHNDGKVIERFMNNNVIKEKIKNGMPLFFEGGANEEREIVCRERGQKPFGEMKHKYELLYNERTGLSVIWEAK